MAKKKTDTVKIKRGSESREIPQSQWDQMKKTDTYGWRLESEIPDDVTTKENQIETSKIKELETAISEKDAVIEQQNTKIKELETELDAVKKDNGRPAALEMPIPDLAKSIEGETDVEKVKNLIAAERVQKDTRKGAVEVLEDKLAELTKS